MGQGTLSKEFAGREYRLLLVGVTGSGKSSLGNAILGREAFKGAIGMRAGTQGCSLERATRHGLTVEVLDTPGFRDWQQRDEDINTTIAKCLGGVSPGPHAVLIVIKATDRYAQDVDAAYIEAKKLLEGKRLANRIILVFTGGDLLRQAGLRFEDEIQNCREILQHVIQDAGQRYVLFNNKATGRENTQQLNALLGKVHDACMQDTPAAASQDVQIVDTYLTSAVSIHLENIINNEAEELVRNRRNFPHAEARFMVRKAMVEATQENQELRDVIARVINRVDLHVHLCTLL